MNIEQGIEIEDEIKTKCSKCNSVIAIHNDAGLLFFRKVTVAFVSIYENLFELKCRDCGTINKVINFPSVSREN